MTLCFTLMFLQVNRYLYPESFQSVQGQNHGKAGRHLRLHFTDKKTKAQAHEVLRKLFFREAPERKGSLILLLGKK